MNLHLKRMTFSLAIGFYFGFQSGWNTQKIASENLIFKFVNTMNIMN